MTSVARGRFDFSIGMSPQWVGYDPDPDPAAQRRSAEEPAGKIIALSPALADSRPVLIERMLGLSREAIGAGAIAAASLWAIVEGTEIVASLRVTAGERSIVGDADAELDQLRQMLRQPQKEDVGERHLRRRFPPDGRSACGRWSRARRGRRAGLVVELIQHRIPVADPPHNLVVSCSTSCIAYGDEMADIFDSIAETLKLT